MNMKSFQACWLARGLRKTGWLMAAMSMLAGVASAQDQVVPGAQAGSLYPFLQTQAERAPLAWSFLNPAWTNAGQWQRETRGKFLELLHYNPPKCDPRPETLERADCGDYVREKVLFNTTPDIRVPAYVLIPKSGPKQHPAVLLLHDHGGFFVWGKEKVIGLDGEHPALAAFKRQYYGGRSLGNELVKRGYVVMAIDMFYWGERRMRFAGDPPSWQTPSKMSAEDVQRFNQRAGENTWLIGNGLFEAGVTWAGVMFTDDLRSLDYLAARPEVDPQRIGCCGLSVGGFRSAHLAGLDARIKAAVVVGWMCSYPAMLKEHLTSIGFWATVPGLQQQMDLPDVVSLAVPNGLLVIHGAKDQLFPAAGVKAAFDKIARVYAKAGAPDNFRSVVYDRPHEFNCAMQDQAFAWLDRWLKGN